MKKHFILILIFKILIESVFSISFPITSSSSTEYPYFKANYEKYSADLNNNFDIPTLESLFQKISFRDNKNSSSECPHKHGRKRDTLCHKLVSFDSEGYEKSIQDTKKLILNRLNLDQEPKIEINKSTLSFIEQLENSMLEEEEQDVDNKYSTMKTKYDMKRYETKEFNSMHEASGKSNFQHFTFL